MDDNTNDPQSQMREDSFSADYTQADGANANMEPSELAEKLDPNIAGQEQQTLAQVDSEGVEIEHKTNKHLAWINQILAA